jgi:hypothetical protein
MKMEYFCSFIPIDGVGYSFHLFDVDHDSAGLHVYRPITRVP